MQTTIFRNPEKLELNKVIEIFRDTLEEASFETSDIEALADAYAKNPIDKFIITEELQSEGGQGDIMIFSENTKFYKEHIEGISNLEKTTRLVLQEGDSFTGDHRIVPLEGTKYTVKTGRFCPNFLKGKRMFGGDPTYNAVVFESDKPFLIVHREHGNIALPAGKYMFCSQLDADTLSRMMD